MRSRVGHARVADLPSIAVEAPEGRATPLAAAGRATIILTGGMLIVQLIGFARQMFLAAEVGITSGLDALLIAMASPAAMVAILTVGITTAIVPAYAEAKDVHGTGCPG